MASVLAFVDQFWLQEHAPNGVCVGDLLPTNSYDKSDEGFAALKDGGYLFLVTLQPPARTLLVAVLEDPRFRGTDPLLRGDGWYAGDNRSPVVDITDFMEKVAFAPSRQFSPDQVAHDEFLRTARVLTDGAEMLLTNLAEPIQVVASPIRGSVGHALRDRARSRSAEKLRFDNYRRARPFGKMSAAEQHRLERLSDTIQQQEEYGGVECVDVVDDQTGRVAYYLYCWPFADGVLVNADDDLTSGDLSDGEFTLREPNRSLRESLMLAYDAAWELRPWFREIVMSFSDRGEPQDEG